MARNEVIKEVQGLCDDYESQIATERAEKVKALEALKVEKSNVIKLSAEITGLRKMKEQLSKVFNPGGK